MHAAQIHRTTASLLIRLDALRTCHCGTRPILYNMRTNRAYSIMVQALKPMTSGTKSEGRFAKQDFVYLHDEDAYHCPAGERPK
jgi:hypothetical protein